MTMTRSKAGNNIQSRKTANRPSKPVVIMATAPCCGMTRKKMFIHAQLMSVNVRKNWQRIQPFGNRQTSGNFLLGGSNYWWRSRWAQAIRVPGLLWTALACLQLFSVRSARWIWSHPDRSLSRRIQWSAGGNLVAGVEVEPPLFSVGLVHFDWDPAPVWCWRSWVRRELRAWTRFMASISWTRMGARTETGPPHCHQGINKLRRKAPPMRILVVTCQNVW